MEHTISISQRAYEILRQQARQAQVSPDSLAEGILLQYFESAGPAWHSALEALIARIHSSSASHSPEEIEADISVASAEARELRRAHRRPS